MRARLSLGLAAIGLVIAGLAAPPAAAGGGEGPRADFYLSRDAGPTLPRLSVRFDRVIYVLGVIGGKYKLFPVTIENRSGARLLLSREEDSFTIMADGHPVRGILDLASADPALWDGLDAEMRQALLYPGELAINATRIIYVLAPAAEIAGMPESFVFAIKSLGRPIELARPPPMKN